MKNYHFIPETQSTNKLLKEMIREGNVEEFTVIRTDFQTDGKGQIGNSWESETRKNLLFSTVLFPYKLPINQNFIISQICSLAIKQCLDNYSNDFTIKWPNDIYWKDKKIGGILIENSLRGNQIMWMIIGIGLNVNQKLFRSNAPNPISLSQIIDCEIEPEIILNDIIANIVSLYNISNTEDIYVKYFESLFRNDDYYPYSSENGKFLAKISAIKPDGRICLITKEGEQKEFYFKEVEFCID